MRWVYPSYQAVLRCVIIPLCDESEEKSKRVEMG